MFSYISQDLLQELFDYKDGLLVRKTQVSNNAKVGDIAGTLGHRGYVGIRINGKIYAAHRLIYIMHNGDIPKDLQIDHINGVRNDNRIENLRLVNSNENQWNRKTAKGYCWHKTMGKWVASIKANGKQKHLGYFDNEKDAHQAYLDAKNKLHVFKVAV